MKHILALTVGTMMFSTPVIIFILFSLNGPTVLASVGFISLTVAAYCLGRAVLVGTRWDR